MKAKILSLVMLLSVVTMSAAQADCSQMYKKFKLNKVPASALSTTGGLAITGVGFLSIEVGVIMAVLASQNAFMISGIALGAGSTAGGIMVSIKGVKNGREFIRKAQAFGLIKEAMNGTGDDLAELAEDLSEETTQTVSIEAVAAVIVKGNNENAFCPDKNHLANKKDIVEYVKENL